MSSSIRNVVRQQFPSGGGGTAINQADLTRLPTLIQGQQLPQMGNPMTMGRPDFAALLSQLQSQAPMGGYMMGPRLQMPQIAPRLPQQAPINNQDRDLFSDGFGRRFSGQTPPYNPNPNPRMGLY